MQNLKRALFTVPGAVGVTVGLTALMAQLIHVPFVSLDDKPEKLSFAINVDIADPDVAPPIQIKQELKTITPPPAPPAIDIQTSTLPSVPIASSDGAIPIFKPLKLDKTVFRVIKSDRDEQPLLRIEPIMPARADRSGHCKVRFAVSTQGKPFSIETLYCTQSVFARPTIKAVEKWVYNPKIRDGVPVTMHGVETQVSYHLTDERGMVIPE